MDNNLTVTMGHRANMVQGETMWSGVYGILEKAKEHGIKSMTGEEESVLSELDYDDPFEDMDEDELGDNEYYEDFEEHDRFGEGWDDD